MRDKAHCPGVQIIARGKDLILRGLKGVKIMAHRYYIKCDEVCQKKVGISLLTLLTILSIIGLLVVFTAITAI